MALCEPCGDLWLRWLDYRPPATMRLVSIGVTTARAVEENRRMRGEDRRKLIRSQLQSIADTCRRNHQPTEGE